MDNMHVIDLHFQDAEHTVAAFLIETAAGPVLIETGPESTWPQLRQSIEQLGYRVEDIQQVLLSHVHLDHAGAAWRLAEAGARIYVHPAGVAHLAQPEKLWDSAKQIYGDAMAPLWGAMQPVPPDQLYALQDGEALLFGETVIRAWFTPGHAKHHTAYQWARSIFTGDVAGVKIEGGPVVPPCPPPDINLEQWRSSIQKLKDLSADTLYLTHFGTVHHPKEHLDELQTVLADWAGWMKVHYDAGTPAAEITPLFVRHTADSFLAAGLSDRHIRQYEWANPSWMSVTGLLRYWKLKEQRRI